jgi:lambda repressor-like predicted transcriptional regulator
MRSRLAGCIATTLSCAALLAPSPAHACGGCFGPQTAFTTVTGHRMAFAVSPERTVLWDQFEYTGAPEDFSWVLPVRPGAYLEASTDAWFEALEAVTQTRVVAPQLNCAGGGSGCGMGAASGDSAAARGTSDTGVQVLHRGTVGPYETVTLRSNDGDALSAWLIASGYFIPPDIEPTIAAYVTEGADFIALRLQPGLGVNQMTPVRVVTPGGEFLLPLRMVAAGVGAQVAIVLYVIGESRFSMPDLREVFVDKARLTWDFTTNSHNYDSLRAQALGELDGFNYLISFANKGAFSRRFSQPGGFPVFYQVSGSFSLIDNFADLYFAQAAANDPRSSASCTSVVADLQRDTLVREEAGSGELDAARLTCRQYDDIAAALIGMHPPRVWISRFELDLPKEALSMDCMLTPETSVAEISNQLQASKMSGRPQGCEEPIFESRLAAGRPGRHGVWLTLVGAALGLWLRRRSTARTGGE